MHRASLVVTALLTAVAARGGAVDERLLAQFRTGDPEAKQRVIEAGVEAVAPLVGMLGDRGARVAWEARSALRWIATRAGDDATRRKAIYDALLPSIDPKRPLAERRAAVELLGLVGDGTDEQVRPLARLVLHEPELARDAVAAIGRMGDGGMGALTCIVWHNGSHLVHDEPPGEQVRPELKALALDIFASRPIADSGRPDVMLDFLRYGAQSEHEAIRVAAMKALGRWGHRDAIPLLLEAIEKGTPPVKAAASDALLAAADARAKAGERDAAVGLYGQCLELAATDAQLIAVLSSLGRLGDPASLPTLQASLQAEAPRVRQAAYAALCQVQGPAGLQAVVDALAGAPDGVKPQLLAALGDRRDPSLGRLLLDSAKSRDVAIAAAAVQALGQVGDVATAAPLLDVAERGASDDVQAAALHVALQLAHVQADQGVKASAYAVFERALRLAQGDAQKAEALRGLAKTGDARALRLLRPIFGNDKSGLRGEAFAVALAVGDAAVARGDRDAAALAFTQVADSKPPDAVAQEAAKKLSLLGVHHDLAARGGHITTWWILGPFDCPDFNAAKRPQFPEREIDLKKAYQVAARTLRWTLHRSSHPKGWVDLNALLKPNDRVLAYCYTELAAREAQDVEMHLGRDDGLTVWLNGQVIYDEHGPHGTAQEDFVVEARLVEGINRILVKSSEAGGGWDFYVRLTDRQGKPLGTQRQ